MDEAAFRDLISGQRRGPLAGLQRAALRGLSLPYSGITRVRNFAYDRGLFRATKVPVPVLSVGNITTGGTGKTPIVAWLVNQLVQRGRRPAILSRGYRALDGTDNDEARVLAALCPGVPHVQNPDRIAGARTAINDSSADVLVLDDGLQHRRLARDLDIVLIDATNPFGYGYHLPRGLLRESLGGLKRAGLIIVTRADQVDDNTLQDVHSRLAEIVPDVPRAEVRFSPAYLLNAAGKQTDFSELAGRRVVGFCGIGNPAAFRQTLTAAGAHVDELIPFPDHHHYTPADLERIAQTVRTTGAQRVLTTQKDLVKLTETTIADVPLDAVVIASEFLSGEECVHPLIDALF